MSRVSIVLPTFNGEKFIGESIDSIINQSFKDWELIIVNDCSNDSTLDIVNHYAHNDNRIKVISNEVNQKLPQSLNIGFQAAKSEYLTWTSDDNYYLPQALDKMVHFLDENPDCQMVVADMENIDAEGVLLGKFYSYDDEFMFYSNCVGACFMYRKSAREAVGEYDPNWFLVEDYEYWLRILTKYKHIGRIDEILYRYRRHNDSLTETRKNEIRKQLYKLRKRNLNDICQALKNNKKLLTCVFIEMKRIGIDKEHMQKFYDSYPNLKMIKPLDNKSEVVIYGAGNYGERAFQILSERVLYFADGDIQKIGKEKLGKEIISLNQFMALEKQPKLVIAISNMRVSEIIEDIISKGVKECSLIQLVEGWNV